MDAFELVIKNYRCFDQAEPVRMNLGCGVFSFVGPNNSGKSSLLRMFYELRQLWWALGFDQAAFAYMLKNGHTINPVGLEDQTELFSTSNDGDLVLELTLPERVGCFGLSLICLRNSNSWRLALKTEGGQIQGRDSGWSNSEHLQVGDSRYDLTRLRTICRSLSSTLYVGSFRNALNVGATDYYDLRIGTHFVEEWNSWKNGPDKTKNRRIQEVTEDIRGIFGFHALEINPSSDHKTLQVFVDRKPYRLSELGGGLAQFIVTLGTAATRQVHIILIDEPELGLHPSLQTDFVTTLGRYSQRAVWFSTHSIGLARAVSDKVYSLQKRGDCSLVRPLADTHNYGVFAGEMGFSSYRELGFERLLLVEGPTEVKTIQQWLRLYRKEHKVVLIHLGGASSIRANFDAELREVQRITEKVSVLIDSELASEQSTLDVGRAAFAATCSNLGFDIHVTSRRATENYFTEAAIQAEKGSNFRALAPHEKLGVAGPAWAKSDNWRIASRMTHADLATTDVGQFLERL